MTTVVAQPKWIGKSTTFWGALIGVAAVAYQTVGPILDAVGVTVPITPVDIQEAGEVGTKALTALAGVVGFAITIYGRFKAGKTAQPVSLAPNAPATTVTVAKPPAGATSKSSG